MQLLVFKSAILKSIQTLRESKKKLPGEYVMHFQECEYLKKFILKKKIFIPSSTFFYFVLFLMDYMYIQFQKQAVGIMF